jgi:hypothetical protein
MRANLIVIRHTLLSLFLINSFVRHCPAESNPCNRATFGATSLPFWNGLTVFDSLALCGADRARAGDPDALFALALFAAGDVRDTALYARYHQRMVDFVKEARPVIERKTSEYDRGKALYEECCRAFFKHRSVNDELKGYSSEQSKLSEIFKNSRFNCISSSLLYMIAARYFGMKVHGVVMPSHAYVRLEMSDGKSVDIQTTSRTGFDMVFNENSFKKLGKRWFTARGLRMPSPEDFHRREIEEPFVTVVQNMNNQHTAPGLMSVCDRNRLGEAMGFCCPDVKEFAYARLVVFNNEAAALHKMDDLPAYERFFSKLLPIVEEAVTRFPGDIAVKDLAAVLELEHGYLLFKQNEPSPAADELFAVAQKVSPAMKDYRLVMNNTSAIVQQLCQQLLQKENYGEAIALVKRFAAVNPLAADMRYYESYSYSAWATSFWTKKEWQRAIEKLRLALSLAEREKSRKTIVTNLQGAFGNWALALYEKKKFTEAAGVLAQCEKEVGLDRQGEVIREKIDKERR